MFFHTANSTRHPEEPTLKLTAGVKGLTRYETVRKPAMTPVRATVTYYSDSIAYGISSRVSSNELGKVQCNLLRTKSLCESRRFRRLTARPRLMQ